MNTGKLFWIAFTIATVLIFSVFRTEAQQSGSTSSIEYTEIARIEADEIVFSVTWSPTDDLIAVSGENGVQLYTSNLDQVITLIFQEDVSTISTVWSPDGVMLASLLANGQVYIWNVADTSTVTVWDAHSITPTSIAWSPDGSRLATGSLDGTVKVYDVLWKQPLDVLSEQYFRSVDMVSWHPNGRLLAFSSPDGVFIWDILLDESVFHLETKSERGVQWSPDGTLLAVMGINDSTSFLESGSSGLIEIWETDDEELLRTLSFEGEPSTSYVYDVAWHPNGRLLASNSRDEWTRIWDTTTGELLAELPGGQELGDGNSPDSLSWSLDGTKLAEVSSDGVVRIWEIIYEP